MLNGVQQSGSQVNGDQVGGNKTVNNNYSLEIMKNLSPAVDPIRKYSKDRDPNNTVLIRKLRDGGFNKTSVDYAITSKATYLRLQIEHSKSQSGRSFFEDAKTVLVTMINGKYISKMDEGESLKTKMDDMVNIFSTVVNKYDKVIPIDEAMVEGMLYVATSECAINWKIEGFEDGD